MEYAVDNKLLSIQPVRIMGFEMFGVYDSISGINLHVFFSERYALTKLMIIVGNK